MKATVNVLCYRSKTLNDGEHPLMICICKDRKRRYISLGVSVKYQFGDFEKNRPKRNCPNREQLNRLIAETEQKYAEQVLEFSTMGCDYTVTTLVETVDNASKNRTVIDLFLNYIEQLNNEYRIGYALSVRQVHSSLLKYRGNVDCYITEIDVAWLKNYEAWLRKQQLNTIGIRFRTLCVI